MKQISEQIYTVEGLRIGRVYAILNPDGVTLIDSGLANAEKKIDQQLGELGKSLKDVRRILITHAHPDHIGSAAAIRAISGAQVCVHARDAAIARGDAPVPRPTAAQLSGIGRLIGTRIPGMPQPPVVVDREFQEGEVFNEVLPNLTVVDTPGHTPGQASFYYPAKKLMFCGDTITRFAGLGLPISFYTPDMDEAKRSIVKIAKMDVEILCFGHGQPIMNNASAALRDFAQKKGFMA